MLACFEMQSDLLHIVEQILKDARVKVTESGYIPGDEFPKEQEHLEGKNKLQWLLINIIRF